MIFSNNVCTLLTIFVLSCTYSVVCSLAVTVTALYLYFNIQVNRSTTLHEITHIIVIHGCLFRKNKTKMGASSVKIYSWCYCPWFGAEKFPHRFPFFSDFYYDRLGDMTVCMYIWKLSVEFELGSPLRLRVQFITNTEHSQLNHFDVMWSRGLVHNCYIACRSRLNWNCLPMSINNSPC